MNLLSNVLLISAACIAITFLICLVLWMFFDTVGWNNLAEAFGKSMETLSYVASLYMIVALLSILFGLIP